MMYKYSCKTLFLLFLNIINLFGFDAVAQQELTNNNNNKIELELNKITKVLKGKLINVPDFLSESSRQINIRIQSLDVDGEYAQTYPIQANGTFEVTLEYHMPVQELLVEIGDYRAWIPVFDSVEAIFDFKSYDQTEAPDITFVGETADRSDFMYAYANAFREFETKDSLDNRIGDLIDDDTDSVSFHQALNKWKMKTANFREEYLKKFPPTSEIKQLIATTHQGKYLTYLLKYYWLTNQPMPKQFLQNIKTLNADLNVLNYVTNNYLYYLSCYMRTDWERNGVDLPVEMFIDEILASDTVSVNNAVRLKRTSILYQQYRRDKATQSNMNYVAELDSNIKIVNELYGSLLEPRIRRWIKENRKTRADYFLDGFPGMIGEILIAKSGPRKDQLTIDSLQTEYRNLLTYIKEPTVSYFIERYINTITNVASTSLDVEVEQVTKTYGDLQEGLTKVDFDTYAALYHNDKLDGNELFDYLIRLNKGKLLLIDFWATWCAPCFEDFEKAKLLKEKLDDSQLVFVYLCADSEQKEWIARIKEKRLEGLHIYLTKPQQQVLFERFKLSGYPSYLFIDKFGKIEFNVRRLLDSPVEAKEFIKQKLAER